MFTSKGGAANTHAYVCGDTPGTTLLSTSVVAYPQHATRAYGSQPQTREGPNNSHTHTTTDARHISTHPCTTHTSAGTHSWPDPPSTHPRLRVPWRVGTAAHHTLTTGKWPCIAARMAISIHTTQAAGETENGNFGRRVGRSLCTSIRPESPPLPKTCTGINTRLPFLRPPHTTTLPAGIFNSIHIKVAMSTRGARLFVLAVLALPVLVPGGLTHTRTRPSCEPLVQAQSPHTTRANVRLATLGLLLRSQRVPLVGADGATGCG